MAAKSYHLRLMISSLVIIATIKLSCSESFGSGAEFSLIHRDHLQPINRSERIRQMLYRDTLHMDRIRRMSTSSSSSHHHDDVGGRRRTMQKNISSATAVIPIASAADFGPANYYVELMVGTPPTKLPMFIDTLKGLTWVYCKYPYKYKRSKNRTTLDFDHATSTSFQTIPCSSPTCKNRMEFYYSPASCTTKPKDLCSYDISYGLGIYATETVSFSLTNGQQTSLEKTFIGCTTSSYIGDNDSTFAGTSGVVGLGNNPLSLPMQASDLFQKQFSYCLVDIYSPKEKSSKLFLGPPQRRPKDIVGPMQSTKLEVNTSRTRFYGVYIKSILVGGKKLNDIIPASTWHFHLPAQGGAIVDAGTTLTYLAGPAYGPVMRALTEPLRGFSRASSALANETFEYCYKGNNDDDELEKSGPEMEIVFEGGARLAINASSYMINVDPENELTCVGIVNNGEVSLSVIGNMFQQKHLWEFDMENGVLRFATSECAY